MYICLLIYQENEKIITFASLVNALPSKVGKESGKIDYLGTTATTNMLKNKNWVKY